MSKATRLRKPVRARLEAMIANIRADVQAYTNELAGVQIRTGNLAPQVSAAYAVFIKGTPDGTKLEFCKFFATEEQLKSYPETDAEAKASTSPVRSLFNGIEYMLRKAEQLARAETEAAEKQRILAESLKAAQKEVKALNLKGEDAEAKIEEIQTAALREAGLTAGAVRVSRDEIVHIVHDGFYSDLDDFDVFSQFVSRILGLKYSDNTVTAILGHAREMVAAEQTTPAPVVETTVATAPTTPEPAPESPKEPPKTEAPRTTPPQVLHRQSRRAQLGQRPHTAVA